jgi:hypothetical protein
VRADSYPCPDTGILLTVRARGNGFIAVASGEHAETGDDLFLNWDDVQAWSLDAEKVRRELCDALGIAPAQSTHDGGILRLGRCDSCSHRGTVYADLSVGGTATIGFVASTAAKREPGYFLLAHINPDTALILERAGVATALLSECVSLSGGSVSIISGWKCRCRAADITNSAALEVTTRRLDKIDGGIANMGKHVVAVEAENSALKEKLANQLATLGRRVEAEFLHWILVILATGSVSAAAKHLAIPNSTFAEKLKRHAERDAVHRTLYSLTAIRRKGIGQKRMEAFSDLFGEHQGERDGTSAEIWKDLLGGLEVMDAGNWQKVRDELLDLVKEQVPEG